MMIRNLVNAQAEKRWVLFYAVIAMDWISSTPVLVTAQVARVTISEISSSDSVS